MNRRLPMLRMTLSATLTSRTATILTVPKRTFYTEAGRERPQRLCSISLLWPTSLPKSSMNDTKFRSALLTPAWAAHQQKPGSVRARSKTRFPNITMRLSSTKTARWCRKFRPVIMLAAMPGTVN